MAGTVFLLVGISIFILSLVVYGIMARAAVIYRERYSERTAGDLANMFLFIEPGYLLVLNLCIMALFLLIGFLFFGWILRSALAIIGFFLPWLLVNWYRKRRIRKFDEQLVDALTSISNGLKAGMNFPQAVENVTKETDHPFRQEMEVFLKEVKLGVTVEDALNNLANRVGSEDLSLVVVSTNTSRQLGGNMAEMFDTIAETIRERFRLEGKIRALTAQGKLQGGIVALLPLIMGFIMDAMKPELMRPMMSHWFGYVLVAVVVIMELAGIFLVYKIVNIDV